MDYPRSAVIVFRFVLEILPISYQASYADSRTLYGLGCPPHTHSHSGGSGALRTTRPTVSSVEKPAIFDTMTGISFQSVIFSSFHCLVTDVKMLQRSKHLIVDNTVLCVTSCCPRFKAVRLIKFKQLWLFCFTFYHDQFTTDCALCRTKHIHRSPKKF